MASVTAAGCGLIVSSAAAGCCGRASSSTLSSVSSSYTSLLAIIPAKNPSLTPLFLRRSNNDVLSRVLLGNDGLGEAAARARAASRAVVRASTRGDDNRDDAGVIKDMELYLNDLSLEYDSVWDTKPAWCQPWTIVGTGVGVITTSWLLFHNAFLTGGATFVISLWWYLFLYAYPQGYADMIAERRRMVEDGSEDIYGRKKVD